MKTPPTREMKWTYFASGSYGTCASLDEVDHDHRVQHAQNLHTRLLFLIYYRNYSVHGLMRGRVEGGGHHIMVIVGCKKQQLI